MAGKPVKVYTIGDVSVDLSTAEYLQGQLNKIGLKATLKPLAGANYFTIMGNQSTKAQIGFTDWFEDFPYPTDWFNTLLNGESITQVHNNNYGNVDIPLRTRQWRSSPLCRRARRSPRARTRSWAAIDKAMSDNACDGAVSERHPHVVLLLRSSTLRVRRLRRQPGRHRTVLPEVTG